MYRSSTDQETVLHAQTPSITNRHNALLKYGLGSCVHNQQVVLHAQTPSITNRHNALTQIWTGFVSTQSTRYTNTVK